MSSGEKPNINQVPDTCAAIMARAQTNKTNQDQELPANKSISSKNFIRERIKSLEMKLKAEKQKNVNLDQQKIEKIQEKAQQEEKNHKSKNKKFHKCQICRSTGKRSQMKLCHNCGHFIHLSCCEDETAQKAKFVCDRCVLQNNKSEIILTKKQQKITEFKAMKQKMDTEKSSKKKVKQEILKKLIQQRPLYFNGNEQIQYPIEDKLLFIYEEYFNIPDFKTAPIDHPLIPCQLLGKFLELQNFIVTYQKDMGFMLNGNHRKQMLYSAMNCIGSDRIFQVILGTIVQMYLKDVFQRSRILNQSNVFIIISTLNQLNLLTLDFIVQVFHEIIRNLMQVSNFKKHLRFQTPICLTLDSKIGILIDLIQGLSQTDLFHEIVSKKSERITELTKERSDLFTQIKSLEGTYLCNKEVRNKKNKQTQKETLERDAMKSLINQHKDRVSKITKEIPYIVSQINYLGSDRNSSKYYFYQGEPHRVYVQYNDFVLEDSENYKIYETKQKIKQLAKSLSVKGTHEKRLQESLNKLLKDQIIKNIVVEEIKSEQERLHSITQLGSCVFVQNDIQFKEKIISAVLSMEQKFSGYLKMKNYEWEVNQKREQFRACFPKVQGIQELKSQLKNLQEHMVLPIKSEGNNSSESDQQKNKQNIKKGKLLRFWGFNGEMRKNWTQCLQNCVNFCGVWICVITMNQYMNNYIEKKIEAIKRQNQKALIRQEKIKNRNKKLTQLKKQQIAPVKPTKLRLKKSGKQAAVRKSTRVQSSMKTRRSANLELKNKKAPVEEEEQQEEQEESEEISKQDQEYKIEDDQ